MPRVSVPPYPIAGGVDDLDEDTPPILPQFSSKHADREGLDTDILSVVFSVCVFSFPVSLFPPAATMIRPSLTRNSSVCRSRRSLMNSPQSSLMSPDPDLLSMAGSSLSYHPEADEEHIMFSSDRRGYVAVAGTPRNGFKVWTYRCFIQTFTLWAWGWSVTFVSGCHVERGGCMKDLNINLHTTSECLTQLISKFLFLLVAKPQTQKVATVM